jgi:cytochrome b
MSKVRVWDLPTRLFHWALVFCVVGLVISGEVGGAAMEWHFRLGYATLTLVLFRLVWGLVGGHWSRFSSFVVLRPSKIIAYLKGNGSHEEAVGHNPLGAFSVLGLLLFTLLQVSTGLLSDDEIATAGPLAAKFAGAVVSLATFVHTEVTKVILIVLVLLHVAAILWYRFKKGNDLVRPMVTGDKELRSGIKPSRDDALTRTFAAAVLILCALAVAALLRWAQ